MKASEIVAASPWGSVIDGSLADPCWADAGKVHDWRNHVPDFLKGEWPRLSEESRAVAYLCAAEAAGREEWD